MILAAVPLAGSARDRSIVTEEDRRFWSFLPVVKQDPPLGNDPWVRSPIDGFILSKIREAGLKPAPEASRALWLRRVSFDLIGLPPTPGELDAFETDTSPEAHAGVIDRLLASRHYGERWATHWLDGVRYVEEVGYYNFSNLGWRYRDWVIKALNQDLPYDQFIVHQIAGDLLPDPGGGKTYADGIIATGFLCMGNFDCQDSEKDRLYSDVIDDQIDVVSRQFLGLTVSCARCHDHEFDPIPTRDYYAMGGVFLSTQVLGTESRIGAKRLRIPIGDGDDPAHHKEREQEKHRIEEKLKTLNKNDAAEKAEIEQLTNLLKRLNSQGGVAMAAREGGYSNGLHKGIGDMPLYIRGDYKTPGEIVPRGVLQVIAGDHVQPIGDRTTQSGRLELARWIADPGNPLTARVMANRIWQHHFGEGIVRTPSNFGALGERPTHPGLLDWLAARFVEGGWSLKQLHREIVLSSTYRQLCNAPASAETDPENKLFARSNRRRLEAEQLHDALLLVSGRLNPLGSRGKETRAIYTHTGHLHPWRVGEVFDSPTAGTMLATREQSTTTPQSLYLLNDEAAIESARNLDRNLSNFFPKIDDRVRAAYRALYGREPSPLETAHATEYLRTTDKPWTFYHVLLCSNEFLHIE